MVVTQWHDERVENTAVSLSTDFEREYLTLRASVAAADPI